MQKLFKSRIKSITKLESKEMYDITIAQNHNLFYNKILVHNCNFRNEILFRYKPTKIYKSYYLQEGKSPKKQLKIYKKGDKIGQATLVLKSNYSLKEVNEINTNTDRGLGGFGSSGK